MLVFAAVGWEDVLMAAIGCYVAFGTAQFGADHEPVSWPLVAAVAIGVGLGFVMVSYSGATGHNAIIALFAFVTSVTIGAMRGTSKKRRRVVTHHRNG